MDLLEHICSSLKQQNVLHSDRLIVVAVSGGPDSLCLLHVLWRLRAEGGPALHVAHLDHCFRGEQSAAEAQFVAATASAWDIPATVEQYDVAAFAQAARQNRQAAARAVRYAFLARVAQRTGASAVAVAHNADDQAETVLLHLLRGAGPGGLRGMRAVVAWEAWRGWGMEHAQAAGTAAQADGPLLVRPLLHTTRAEIEQYCAEQSLTPQRDPSNTALYYTRNRIRADLLPHLAAYNQQIVTALGRTAQVCADDYAYIQSQLDAIWPRLVTEHAAARRFHTATWAQLPTALQRYALRRAAFDLIGSDDLSYEQVEAGRAATLRTTGYQQPLAGGLMLQVEYDTFVVAHSSTPDVEQYEQTVPQLATDELPIEVPGVTMLSAAWRVESGYTEPEQLPADGRWRWWVALDADALDGPPVLRRRRAGDRFRPAGGRGSRSLQDFFVDQKVPRSVRGAWPVLATSTQIIWIAGLRADSRFQATPATRNRLWVVLRHTLPQETEATLRV